MSEKGAVAAEKPKKKRQGESLKHLFAGGVAGAVSRTCVSPLERLKILYQVWHQVPAYCNKTNNLSILTIFDLQENILYMLASKYRIFTHLKVQPSSQIRYKGILDSLRTILKEEGIMGYFKGNGTNVIRIFPYSA